MRQLSLLLEHDVDSIDGVKHAGRIYKFNPVDCVWQYRFEEDDNWKPVTNKLILKLLEWDELEGFEYAYLSGDAHYIEVFVAQDGVYDLDLVEQKLLNHPLMTQEGWDFILFQRDKYQEEVLKAAQYNDAWCAPKWDITQYGLYKASKNKQYQIIKDAFEVIKRGY